MKKEMLWRCFLLLCLSVVASGYVSLKEDVCGLHNAALFKPATQSSQYGICTADLAVDGDRDPYFKHCLGSCSCTTSTEDVTWWQVDLGDLFDIVQVKVTNRNCCGWRLHDFDIRVSMTSSMTSSDLCAHYEGAVDDSVTETVMCDTTTRGRYLRISKMTNRTVSHGDHLTLCEVEVLVKTRMNLKLFRHAQQKVVSSNTLMPVTHRILCGQACLQSSTCVGFNYQEGTNLCQLLYSTDSPVADTDWWMYSLGPL